MQVARILGSWEATCLLTGSQSNTAPNYQPPQVADSCQPADRGQARIGHALWAFTGGSGLPVHPTLTNRAARPRCVAYGRFYPLPYPFTGRFSTHKKKGPYFYEPLYFTLFSLWQLNNKSLLPQCSIKKVDYKSYFIIYHK